MNIVMILALFALVGCGERVQQQLDLGNSDGLTLAGSDGGIATCGSTIGTATVTGSVQGKAVQANRSSGFTIRTTSAERFGVSLIQHPTGGTCSALHKTVTTASLVAMLCDGVPGSYTLGQACPAGSKAAGQKNQVTIPTPGQTSPLATSGTVTISALDVTCGGLVRGSFDVSFGAERVQGSFATVGCGRVDVP